MAETDKNTRILELHTMLTRGECLRKKDLAQRFGVTEKSIQRDIEDLRDFFTRSGEPRVLAYDAKERAYVLRADKALALTNSEVLAVAKILLESLQYGQGRDVPDSGQAGSLLHTKRKPQTGAVIDCQRKISLCGAASRQSLRRTALGAGHCGGEAAGA